MADYLESYRGKTVLVTGGAGSIGSNLTRALVNAGAGLVIILDDLSASYEWNIPSEPSVLLVKGSVTDEVCLKRVFNEKPSHVFHLAAFFANQNSVDYPERDLEVNGLGTLRLLEYATLAGVDRLVYASSGCSIYGSSAPLPLREDFMSMHLTTPYQITKMLGELYCNFFNHHYGLNIVNTRFFNSYGPGEVPGQYRNVIPNFIYWAMQGLPLPITGTGDETRDFTYVGDLVDGLLRAGYFDAAISEPINLASEREIKIVELATMINQMVENDAGINFVNRRKWDTKARLLASVDKARAVLEYEPDMSFEQGLRNTVDWFKANWINIEASASFSSGVSSAVREQTTVKPK
ncbi:MAG: NAD-dependent epimerase/dehydratase family protein [Chloroflexi bacterium]|nr:NAD-dependent epimerase/dehydratase family protein [Chloroflexota bacterium]MDA1219317.1 NAD-dependent epimerase/dehydratase family protein [Chloroflexota bacterium]